nr:hypothetical protein [Sphingomonas bacterium]
MFGKKPAAAAQAAPVAKPAAPAAPVDVEAVLEQMAASKGGGGSAEQNMALSKAVWKKLAENGGKVPASLKD